MKAIVVIFSFAAVFCLLEVATSIRCYECNSYYQQDCSDHFDNQTINMVDCSAKIANASRCRKQIQEMWIEDHWDIRYIRQCASIGDIGDYEGRQCKERAGTYKVKVRYCHCDNQDGCNTASALSSLLGFSLPIAVFFLLKLLR
ncbi:UPAR/Ly6 domain-containing protein crok-like [Liolophura sinensis]|uniref:UPAR/Ly6 domain-containing protein crok-like n=1 Tax=Liolophura sinensis TaxID=3198878 RepID=UPI003158BA68